MLGTSYGATHVIWVGLTYVRGAGIPSNSTSTPLDPKPAPPRATTSPGEIGPLWKLAAFTTAAIVGTVAVLSTVAAQPSPSAALITIWTSATLTTPSPFRSLTAEETPKA